MAVETATIETLTATVRTLMVGSRQVTLSVYKQLDSVKLDRIEPFGRVNVSDNDLGQEIVGRHKEDGVLVRCWVAKPRRLRTPYVTTEDGPEAWKHWAHHHFGTGKNWPATAAISAESARAQVVWKESFFTHTYDGPPCVPPMPDLEKEWREIAAGELEDIESMLDSNQEAHEVFNSIMALPLIVLAGLR